MLNYSPNYITPLFISNLYLHGFLFDIVHEVVAFLKYASASVCSVLHCVHTTKTEYMQLLSTISISTLRPTTIDGQVCCFGNSWLLITDCGKKTCNCRYTIATSYDYDYRLWQSNGSLPITVTSNSKHTNRQTGRQKDRQAGRQTDKQQTDRQAGRHARQAKRHNEQADR